MYLCGILHMLSKPTAKAMSCLFLFTIYEVLKQPAVSCSIYGIGFLISSYLRICIGWSAFPPILLSLVVQQRALLQHVPYLNFFQIKKGRSPKEANAPILYIYTIIYMVFFTGPLPPYTPRYTNLKQTPQIMFYSVC